MQQAHHWEWLTQAEVAPGKDIQWLKDGMAMLWVPLLSALVSLVAVWHAPSLLPHPPSPEYKEAEGLVCFISGQMGLSDSRDNTFFFVFFPIKLDVE